MNGYIKYFDDGTKNMLFITDDEKVYAKYNEIWNVIKKLFKLKFTIGPILDDKYLFAKVKILNGINNTTFTDERVRVRDTSAEHVPVEKKSLFMHFCNRY